jgi:hypothetical protein
VAADWPYTEDGTSTRFPPASASWALVGFTRGARLLVTAHGGPVGWTISGRRQSAGRFETLTNEQGCLPTRVSILALGQVKQGLGLGLVERDEDFAPHRLTFRSVFPTSVGPPAGFGKYMKLPKTPGFWREFSLG